MIATRSHLGSSAIADILGFVSIVGFIASHGWLSLLRGYQEGYALD